MILKDRLSLMTVEGTVLDEIKAHVGTTTIGVEQVTAYISRNVEELRALIKPHPSATSGRRYKWRGVSYKQVGDPLVRRKHGRDHHYTIKLERVSESA